MVDTKRCRRNDCHEEFTTIYSHKVYCSSYCQKIDNDRNYRREHREADYIHNIKRYDKLKSDPTYKKKRKIYFKKWYEANKAHQFENCRKGYHKNKAKWIARNLANVIIRIYYPELPKVCHICKDKTCRLEFTIYPKTREKVKEAILSHDIRYVCEKHRVVKLGKKPTFRARLIREGKLKESE